MCLYKCMKCTVIVVHFQLQSSFLYIFVYQVARKGRNILLNYSSTFLSSSSGRVKESEIDGPSLGDWRLGGMGKGSSLRALPSPHTCWEADRGRRGAAGVLFFTDPACSGFETHPLLTSASACPKLPWLGDFKMSTGEYK